MTAPQLQIVTHDIALAPNTEADIRRRVALLSHAYGRILGCRVRVDLPQHRRRVDAARYRVRIDLTVPGGELVVNQQPRQDLETALDGAFQAMRRRLQDYARRQRGAVKVHESQAKVPDGV